jgi:hypothetical protein
MLGPPEPPLRKPRPSLTPLTAPPCAADLPSPPPPPPPSRSWTSSSRARRRLEPHRTHPPAALRPPFLVGRTRLAHARCAQLPAAALLARPWLGGMLPPSPCCTLLAGFWPTPACLDAAPAVHATLRLEMPPRVSALAGPGCTPSRAALAQPPRAPQPSPPPPTAQSNPPFPCAQNNSTVAGPPAAFTWPAGHALPGPFPPHALPLLDLPDLGRVTPVRGPARGTHD